MTGAPRVPGKYDYFLLFIIISLSIFIDDHETTRMFKTSSLTPTPT